nr:exodeoxyribonuclease VII large subunit [Actinomycetota bacterium]
MSVDRALTVKEAMFEAKRALEDVQVRVIGEVSEFNDKPGYKAAYFAVGDGEATMPCMMWRDQYRASGVQLRCGALVELTGAFSAYVPKGRMQFMVKSLQLAGEGVLRMQVAEVARKLEAEGLMRAERKRPLPRFPLRIAVVTSPRGKAIHDVIRTLRRRYPQAELLVAGVQVEGAGAAAAIVHGMRAAAEARPDVILLVRGGGSYEDLMPFNDAEVARAVARSPVPVVTGIGHEPDTSISDMVADLRASTPTAAAEAAAPTIEDMRNGIETLGRRLGKALTNRLQLVQHDVRQLAERPAFRDPRVIVGPMAQRLDLMSLALNSALPGRLDRDAQRVQFALESMRNNGARLLDRPRDRFAGGAARLHDLSPLSILGRGYAVCFASDGK